MHLYEILNRDEAPAYMVAESIVAIALGDPAIQFFDDEGKLIGIMPAGTWTGVFRVEENLSDERVAQIAKLSRNQVNETLDLPADETEDQS